jgi:hypothetical protein
MMENITFEEVIDHRVLDTESVVKQILTILLIGEGKFGLIALILLVIFFFIRRLLHNRVRKDIALGEPLTETP